MPRWYTAPEATAHLGVKRATLYTYASRGWVRTRRAGGRRKLYHGDDVEHLARRASAHGGHGARAEAALAWGEPVLTTEVGAIDADGPYYRGVPALDLLDRTLEWVADHLWQAEPGPWPTLDTAMAPDLFEMRRVLDSLACDDPHRAVQAAELPRARRIVAALRSCARIPADLEPALVMCVDHGLNASTFTARVVASTGADLYACVSAALCALSGPRHGTASLAVQRLLDLFVRDPGSLVAEATDRGGLPGFGHPLYPAGDPRAEALLERAGLVSGALPELVDAARQLGLLPNLDVGLLAMCIAGGHPAALAPRVFAVGRSVGWIAHVFEQRARPGLLRPTSRYAGW